MRQVVLRDLTAELDAGLAGEAVVDAAPDAGVDDLGPEIGGRREVTHGVQVAGRPGRVEAVDVDVDRISPEELG